MPKTVFSEDYRLPVAARVLLLALVEVFMLHTVCRVMQLSMIQTPAPDKWAAWLLLLALIQLSAGWLAMLILFRIK